MLNQNKISAVFMAAAFTLSISSCKKETPPVKSPAANQTEVAKISKELFSIAFSSSNPNLSFKDGTFDCAIIKTDTVSSPHTTTVDYGTGCKDENGIVRKGIVILTYNSSDIQTPGTQIVYSFKNFFINNDEVKGTLSLENTGVNGNGNMVIKYNVDCKDISLINGVTQVSAVEEFEWIEGSKTWLYTDDIFSITGYNEITTQAGVQSKVTINDPLILNSEPGCNQYFVKGTTITHTNDNTPDKYLDYGDGTCDNLAVETINGQSKTIELE